MSDLSEYLKSYFGLDDPELYRDDDSFDGEACDKLATNLIEEGFAPLGGDRLFSPESVAELARQLAALEAEYDAVGLVDGQRTPAMLVQHWKANAGLAGYINGMMYERTSERGEAELEVAEFFKDAKIGSWVRRNDSVRVWRGSDENGRYEIGNIYDYHHAAIKAGEA